MFLKRTNTGKIVYERKKHDFKWRDSDRITSSMYVPRWVNEDFIEEAWAMEKTAFNAISKVNLIGMGSFLSDEMAEKAGQRLNLDFLDGLVNTVDDAKRWLQDKLGSGAETDAEPKLLENPKLTIYFCGPPPTKHWNETWEQFEKRRVEWLQCMGSDEEQVADDSGLTNTEVVLNFLGKLRAILEVPSGSD